MPADAINLCHLCGIVLGFETEKVYYDSSCGLEICSKCQKTLGESHPLIPLRHEIYEEEENVEKSYVLEEEKRQNKEDRIQLEGGLIDENSFISSTSSASSF